MYEIKKTLILLSIKRIKNHMEILKWKTILTETKGIIYIDNRC